MSIQFDLFQELRKVGLPCHTVTYNAQTWTVRLEFSWVDQVAGTRHNLDLEVDDELFSKDPWVGLQAVVDQFHAETRRANMATIGGSYLISTANSNTPWYPTNGTFTVKPGEWYETGSRITTYEEKQEQIRKEAALLAETKRLQEEKEEQAAIASIMDALAKKAKSA